METFNKAGLEDIIREKYTPRRLGEEKDYTAHLQVRVIAPQIGELFSCRHIDYSLLEEFPNIEEVRGYAINLRHIDELIDLATNKKLRYAKLNLISFGDRMYHGTHLREVVVKGKYYKTYKEIRALDEYFYGPHGVFTCRSLLYTLPAYFINLRLGVEASRSSNGASGELFSFTLNSNYNDMIFTQDSLTCLYIMMGNISEDLLAEIQGEKFLKSYTGLISDEIVESLLGFPCLKEVKMARMSVDIAPLEKRGIKVICNSIIYPH